MPAVITGQLPARWLVSESVSSTRGARFYDGNREYPYWASNSSQHKTREGAIKALADHYDRSPEWVLANMGGGNDLSAIHLRLERFAGYGIAAPDPAEAKALQAKLNERKRVGLREIDALADQKKAELIRVAKQKAQRYRIQPGMSAAERAKNKRQFEAEMAPYIQAAKGDVIDEMQRHVDHMKDDMRKSN